MKNLLLQTVFITLIQLGLGIQLYAQVSPPVAALTCVACHGSLGFSNNPAWPNLAGQKKDYLEKQIHDFKKGNRKDVLMSPISNLISDSDIPILAEYFSKLKP